MTRSKRINKGERSRRRVVARGVQKDTPDLRKLGRAVVQLALEQAAAEAAAQAETHAREKHTESPSEQ